MRHLRTFTQFSMMMFSNSLHTATRYNTLQHTATRCNTRHCEAFDDAFENVTICWTGLGFQISVLQCVAVYCSVLQCVVVCCSVFYLLDRPWHFSQKLALLWFETSNQCVAVCCSVLQCVAICFTLWGLEGREISQKQRYYDLRRQISVLCCSALQCTAVCCSAL